MNGAAFAGGVGTYWETLVFLASYTARNRGVGHTSAMLDGAANTPDALIVVDQRLSTFPAAHGRNFQRQIVTLDEVERRLAGTNRPLAIDHFALERLVAGAAREIEALRQPPTAGGYRPEFRVAL